jgi:hypothetical protein
MFLEVISLFRSYKTPHHITHLPNGHDFAPATPSTAAATLKARPTNIFRLVMRENRNAGHDLTFRVESGDIYTAPTRLKANRFGNTCGWP